ncbi:unnamed protein product [Arabidopsis lyrata]|nr:unnamed protein product [Arabidopsis lyrata]
MQGIKFEGWNRFSRQVQKIITHIYSTLNKIMNELKNTKVLSEACYGWFWQLKILENGFSAETKYWGEDWHRGANEATTMENDFLHKEVSLVWMCTGARVGGVAGKNVEVE